MADDPRGLFQANRMNMITSRNRSRDAFSKKSDDEVNQAILSCRKSLAPSEGRAKLADCVKKRLGG
jgi:hypothetical protein